MLPILFRRTIRPLAVAPAFLMLAIVIAVQVIARLVVSLF